MRSSKYRNKWGVARRIEDDDFANCWPGSYLDSLEGRMSDAEPFEGKHVPA